MAKEVPVQREFLKKNPKEMRYLWGRAARAEGTAKTKARGWEVPGVFQSSKWMWQSLGRCAQLL